MELIKPVLLQLLILLFRTASLAVRWRGGSMVGLSLDFVMVNFW